MKNPKITSVVKIVQHDGIPIGEYAAKWGGYVITFVIGGNVYQAATDIGIRGTCDCTVIVSMNGIEVKQ